MPGHRAGGGRAMRALASDRSVTAHELRRGTLRRILGYARPFRGQLATFLAVIVVDGALGAAPPLLYKQIIDGGIATGDKRLVLTLAAVVAALSVISAGLGLLQRWLSASIGEGLVLDLRTRVYDHVQRLPLAFFSRTRTGALVSRLNGDVAGAQRAFTSTLSNVVGNAVGVTATLAAMLALSWRITLLALVVLPLFLVPARLVGRRLAVLTRDRYGLNASMGETMTDRFNVAGAQLVKLFGRPHEESRLFAERAGRLRDIGVRTALVSRLLMGSLGLVAALATALVYGLGGTLVIGGTLGVGTLVALAAYLRRLYHPLIALSNVQVDVMTTLVSFERVFEVLDLEPTITERADARALPPGPLGFELRDVAFAYPAASDVSLPSLESEEPLASRPGDTVLHEISFTAGPGEMVALVGPSGAGKSTIAALVPRLYDAVAGSVRIGDRDVRDLRLDSLRAAAGVVPQTPHLFHDTLRANLAYARPDASEEELRAALAAAQILPLIDSLPEGLDTVVGDHGHRLSGGEKQRLAIARLLLKDPRIVILDEATAHLDSASEAAVQEALDRALSGRTSLVIAHRLATVRRADQILVVDAGRIIERGTHDELLLRRGLYAELCRTQLGNEPADRVAEASGAGTADRAA